MSLTYPDTRPEPQPIVPEMSGHESGAFTPVYARRPARRKGKVKSWMILAPVGALTVAAIGAWALMNPGEETAAPAADEPAPIAAPAPATDPLLTEAASAEDAALQSQLDAAPAPAEASPAPVASTPRAEPAPAPAAREAPAEPAAEPVETVAPPAGPQSYDAVIAAEGGAATEAEPAAPTPLIVVEPN
ncbi:MAG: hypothetical protein ACI8U3_001491 [Brevundimonas sp.]|jgi:hypothetical protein|uniref:hypothetical protein n=1 Tax=Brevundimonas sp. TaxID=1871086 RepID=UPI0039E22745